MCFKKLDLILIDANTRNQQSWIPVLTLLASVLHWVSALMSCFFKIQGVYVSVSKLFHLLYYKYCGLVYITNNWNVHISLHLICSIHMLLRTDYILFGNEKELKNYCKSQTFKLWINKGEDRNESNFSLLFL